MPMGFPSSFSRRGAKKTLPIAMLTLLLVALVALGTFFFASSTPVSDLSRRYATNGGEGGELRPNREQNSDQPSKPVVIASGHLDLDATSQEEHIEHTSLVEATALESPNGLPTEIGATGGTVNGVIIFLHGGRWHSYFIRHTLPTLERYFLSCHKGLYPLRIFYESLGERERSDIVNAVPSAKEVTFEDVSHFWKVLPHSVSEAKMNEWVAAMPNFQGRGYRLMCRFWAGLVWQLPSMRQYDYYWRLDTDSILKGPLLVDPFVTMRDNKCEYGYNRLKGENPHTFHHLFSTFNKWADKAITDSVLRERINAFAIDNKTGRYWGPMYYNNFELGTMRLKTDPLYQSMFKYLDAEEPLGILRYRWGDAPIHTLGVHAVLGPQWEQKMCFFDKTSVPYGHAVKRPPPLVESKCIA